MCSTSDEPTSSTRSGISVSGPAACGPCACCVCQCPAAAAAALRRGWLVPPPAGSACNGGGPSPGLGRPNWPPRMYCSCCRNSSSRGALPMPKQSTEPSYIVLAVPWALQQSECAAIAPLQQGCLIRTESIYAGRTLQQNSDIKLTLLQHQHL